jgi:serine/threonine protein kinase
MHNQNITHRDLKPENILLESKDVDNLSVKIADFGFSCFFDPEKGLDLVLGSPLYMAPEIIRIGDNKQVKMTYNEKVDVWSIGVITYMLLTGRNPYPGKTKQEVKSMIVNTDINYQKPFFKSISKEAINFLQMALTKPIG